MRRPRTSLRRKSAKRNPKQKFIIFSEGRNTERVYFQAIENNYPGALIEVEIVEAAGQPKRIAKKVLKRMKELKRERKAESFAKNDTVWAVFDQDQHDDVPQSIQQCKSAGADVAYSNPCFEIWLILHYQDFHKSHDGKQVQQFLRSLDPTYEPKRTKTPNCEPLMRSIEEAEQRAIAQLEVRKEQGDPMGRPCTTVYKLTQAIRRAAGISNLGRC